VKLIYRCTLLLAAVASSLHSQPNSSFRYTVKDGMQTIEITNVTYEVPTDSFVLRTTMHSTHVIGDIGSQATISVQAWKLGVDMKQKPSYSFTVEGDESRTVEREILTVSRGLEEVAWWSVYRLANGAHLFDTYVPLVTFSVGRESNNNRYAGLEVPPDDTKNSRLKDPHVVAVVSYASEAKLIREVLITCDDPEHATLLRSFADSSRTLTAHGEPSPTLQIAITQEAPAPKATTVLVIPVAGDDLDIAHARLPPHLHLAAWKR
jgi:hypothetical protein